MKITVAVAGDEVPNSSDWNNLSSIHTSQLSDAPEAGHSNYGRPRRVLPHAGPHARCPVKTSSSSLPARERVNAITSPAVPPSMDPSWRSTSRPTSCPAATPATGAARRSTWWPHCAASLLENKAESCPSGHQLWPGKAQVSWTRCVCEPAREAAAQPRHGTRPRRLQQLPRPAQADRILRTAARPRASAAHRLGDRTLSSALSASATTVKALATAEGRPGADGDYADDLVGRVRGSPRERERHDPRRDDQGHGRRRPFGPVDQHHRHFLRHHANRDYLTWSQRRTGQRAYPHPAPRTGAGAYLRAPPCQGIPWRSGVFRRRAADGVGSHLWLSWPLARLTSRSAPRCRDGPVVSVVPVIIRP